MSRGVLLDTHALIWIVLGSPIRGEAADAAAAAAAERALHVSAATAWEVGLICHKPALTSVMGRSARDWFAKAIEITRANLVSLDADLMLDVGELPEPVHRDPTDRMLIATARANDLTLVTRDRAILTYAALGHVRAIAC
ncbi:MAG: type II toxin-antitoxin system VapC family toxin [Brevundimonas sp.]|nr:type II toxin-antitoxin system VapC family toxin [Brevundimonas sp.]